MPSPLGEFLAGWIREVGDLVDKVTVELLVEQLERSLDVGEIHDAAGLRIDRPAYVDGHAERVAVESRAFVTRRGVGEPMCGFEAVGDLDLDGILAGQPAMLRGAVPHV